MQRVEAVVDCFWSDDAHRLKKYALHFDQLHLLKTMGSREYDYLREIGWVAQSDINPTSEGFRKAFESDDDAGIVAARKLFEKYLEDVAAGHVGEPEVMDDFVVRAAALDLQRKTPNSEVIPICWTSLPEASGALENKLVVINVAIEQFPTPGPGSAWEDIFDFKKEMHDKQWSFRRFLSQLATKSMTNAEITDQFEYLLNGYKKEMDRYKLQKTIGFWEAYMIPTIEALETLRLSAALKGIVAIKKRKLALMDGEAKTDGQPIAYVFEAQKKFGHFPL